MSCRMAGMPFMEFHYARWRQCRRHKGCNFNPWGWDDPLEKEMATHSSISYLENSMDRGTWRATVHRVPELDTTRTQQGHVHVIRHIP